MEFRLSDYTKTLLAKSNYKSIQKKQIEYYGSKKYYDTHPDLIPSDISIYEGRIISQKKWDKAIKRYERNIDFKIFINNVKEHLINIPNKIKKIFNKKSIQVEEKV